MIEIVVLFLAICGAFGAPFASSVNRESRNLGNDAIDDSEIIEAPLPGAENLNEKALPISRLFVIDTSNSLPGSENLRERTQLHESQHPDFSVGDEVEDEGAKSTSREPLPGTKILAEKAIPEFVIRRMSKEFNAVSDYRDFEKNPVK